MYGENSDRHKRIVFMVKLFQRFYRVAWLHIALILIKKDSSWSQFEVFSK